MEVEACNPDWEEEEEKGEKMSECSREGAFTRPPSPGSGLVATAETIQGPKTRPGQK